ncbi:MAG: exosortase/archaeosortase family protein, partial [Hyphomicrobiales bacterium]|nr:exosortase/archaeosortase family protein [Hyphomicrobiales bacterium]
MTSIEAPTQPQSTTQSAKSDWLKILLPYGLAILVQIPMLMLYFRQLWSRPHYQPFAVAILAAVGLALYRWPFEAKRPFHKSLASDVLLVMGLGMAFLGMLFVEPWFAAFSAILLTTSLFARTLDKETLASLWPCSLPLYVYLMLPAGMDVRLITKLQQYSAVHTSKLLDLAGLGHHMTGTVIQIPGMKDYGIERACSGIQSFFTLLLVAVIYIVATRRIRMPRIGLALLTFIFGLVSFVVSWNMDSPVFVDAFALSGVAFVLYSILGFQATALLVSAVFWAIFMNTLRILSIPLIDHFLQIDLSEGMSHDFLGYVVLTLGILMILSTSQFLIFLFGPVDTSSGEAGRFGGFFTKIWNETLSGTTNDQDELDAKNKMRAANHQPVGALGKIFIWASTGLIAAFGVFQLIDVQRSKAHPDLKVRF